MLLNWIGLKALGARTLISACVLHTFAGPFPAVTSCPACQDDSHDVLFSFEVFGDSSHLLGHSSSPNLVPNVARCPPNNTFAQRAHPRHALTRILSLCRKVVARAQTEVWVLIHHLITHAQRQDTRFLGLLVDALAQTMAGRHYAESCAGCGSFLLSTLQQGFFSVAKGLLRWVQGLLATLGLQRTSSAVPSTPLSVDPNPNHLRHCNSTNLNIPPNSSVDPSSIPIPNPDPAHAAEWNPSSMCTERREPFAPPAIDLSAVLQPDSPCPAYPTPYPTPKAWAGGCEAAVEAETCTEGVPQVLHHTVSLLRWLDVPWKGADLPFLHDLGLIPFLAATAKRRPTEADADVGCHKARYAGLAPPLLPLQERYRAHYTNAMVQGAKGVVDGELQMGAACRGVMAEVYAARGWDPRAPALPPVLYFEATVRVRAQSSVEYPDRQAHANPVWSVGLQPHGPRFVAGYNCDQCFFDACLDCRTALCGKGHGPMDLHLSFPQIPEYSTANSVICSLCDRRDLYKVDETDAVLLRSSGLCDNVRLCGEFGRRHVTVGCGIKTETQEVFFAVDGRLQWPTFPIPRDAHLHTAKWFPTVHTQGCAVRLTVNFGAEPFRFRDWAALLDAPTGPLPRTLAVDVVQSASVLLRRLVALAADTVTSAADCDGDGPVESAAGTCLREGLAALPALVRHHAMVLHTCSQDVAALRRGRPELRPWGGGGALGAEAPPDRPLPRSLRTGRGAGRTARGEAVEATPGNGVVAVPVPNGAAATAAAAGEARPNRDAVYAFPPRSMSHEGGAGAGERPTEAGTRAGEGAAAQTGGGEGADAGGGAAIGADAAAREREGWEAEAVIAGDPLHDTAAGGQGKYSMAASTSAGMRQSAIAMDMHCATATTSLLILTDVLVLLQDLALRCVPLEQSGALVRTLLELVVALAPLATADALVQNALFVLASLLPRQPATTVDAMCTDLFSDWGKHAPPTPKPTSTPKWNSMPNATSNHVGLAATTLTELSPGITERQGPCSETTPDQDWVSGSDSGPRLQRGVSGLTAIGLLITIPTPHTTGLLLQLLQSERWREAVACAAGSYVTAFMDALRNRMGSNSPREAAGALRGWYHCSCVPSGWDCCLRCAGDEGLDCPCCGTQLSATATYPYLNGTLAGHCDVCGLRCEGMSAADEWIVEAAIDTQALSAPER